MLPAPTKNSLPLEGCPVILKSESYRLRRLDGLRGIAVLMVFVHHVFYPPHGWEGVTLFFIISGFLITGILRRTRTKPDFWRSFYIKRAARILPPLVIFFILTVSVYRSEVWRLPFYICFAANIMEAFHPAPGHIEFVILWSLAVEEHFYLLWPFAVRFLSRSRLIQLSIAIIVLDPVLRLIATPWFSTYFPIYLLTPFQVDGLAAGSLIAVLNEDERFRPVLARWSGPMLLFFAVLYAALSYLVPSFARVDNSRLFNGGGYTILVLGMAAVLASIYYHPKSLPSRILASPPVFFMGSISYGFYLFHRVMQDIAFRLIKSTFSVPHGRWAQPVGFLLAIGLSWLSFHFYEKPIIRWGRRLAESPGDAKSVPLSDV